MRGQTTTTMTRGQRLTMRRMTRRTTTTWQQGEPQHDDEEPPQDDDRDKDRDGQWHNITKQQWHTMRGTMRTGQEWKVQAMDPALYDEEHTKKGPRDINVSWAIGKFFPCPFHFFVTNKVFRC
jgi:hypothetical protein